MEIKIRTKANKTDGRFYAGAVQIPNWMWGALKSEAVKRGCSEHHIFRIALAKELKQHNPNKNTPKE